VSSSFALLGVPERVAAALSRKGIDEPFPIQAATIPDALAGRDIAGRAPTGSGKTLAFGVAVAAHLGEQAPQPRRPRALVLVPTRELAAQVQRELQGLVAPQTGPVTSIYGGVGYGPQRKSLARGTSTVVACPGRLEDLLGTRDIDLSGVDLVVIDEADRMADMGFLPAVERLVDRTAAGRQVLLFSATLDGDVDRLVRRYQNDPVRYEVAGSEADQGDVTHLFWRLPRADRIDITRDVVVACGPTIVFCRTCHGADRVARQLEKAGIAAVAIHGRRSQGQRDRALAAFTSGRAPPLVATDVAARGIHVDGVGAVVHFDLPEDPKDYVHRSGRTARAGADGVVVALVPKEDGDGKARILARKLPDVGSITPVDMTVLEGRAPTGARAHAPAKSSAEALAASGNGSSDRSRSYGGYNGGRSSGPAARRRRDERRGDGERSTTRARRNGNGSSSGSGAGSYVGSGAAHEGQAADGSGRPGGPRRRNGRNSQGGGEFRGQSRSGGRNGQRTGSGAGNRQGGSQQRRPERIR
jgi:superfamily II DNA/RNA helicase